MRFLLSISNMRLAAWATGQVAQNGGLDINLLHLGYNFENSKRMRTFLGWGAKDGIPRSFVKVNVNVNVTPGSHAFVHIHIGPLGPSPAHP
ncbi:MAG: hypothetical protein EBZ05_08535 [Verrucomicrobia bacterium]|nr:hypothetical protein [Verrucomicrobiota bacterium]